METRYSREALLQIRAALPLGLPEAGPGLQLRAWRKKLPSWHADAPWRKTLAEGVGDRASEEAPRAAWSRVPLRSPVLFGSRGKPRDARGAPSMAADAVARLRPGCVVPSAISRCNDATQMRWGTPALS